MRNAKAQQEQAARYEAEAIRLYDAGTIAEAIKALRQAVLHYAAAMEEGATVESAAVPTPQPAHSAPPEALIRARADACQRFGDYLTEAGEHPEAANIYQEAVDLYTRLGGPEAEQQARICARKILANVTALRSQPHERLYLLVAHYERRQQQFALEPGTEVQQAECSVHIARIFQRRERPEEAIARYRQALQFYTQATLTPDVQLARAECHHRIATLLAYALHDLTGAVHHFQEAIALYAVYELPVYEVQPALALCKRSLAEVESRLRREGGQNTPRRE